MSLPKYYQDRLNELSYGNKSHYKNVLEALTIAWEALEESDKGAWYPIAKDAMRRITDIGK